MSARKPVTIQGPEDIRAFFDDLASDYRDLHGNAERLLRYRLGVIERLLGAVPRTAENGSRSHDETSSCNNTLLEIGCGNGMHLFALAHRFRRCIGVDLSPKMIAAAESVRRIHPLRERIELFPAPAETLEGVRDTSVDVALCVGVLEHIPNQEAALCQIRRVLKPGGACICLTPNAGFLWHRWAPRLGRTCQYLSTDRFLDAGEARRMIREAGLEMARLDYWRFVPRGDLSPLLGWGLTVLDWPGRWLHLAVLRGGLCFKAVRRAYPVDE
ncbi:class I SAM-dependent methyltransferase [Methylohalobius crimeensis]|uniref:class I SAM-dependent methyltransferase n=1 Tax=Methylohalobius crimeensis TaxID=244365 RepID=UPI0003B58B07|nr:class I SAM-dependent methyltransferase [Methylohalobius crimeensis]